MVTFYEWLQDHQDMVNGARTVHSVNVIGSVDLPLGIARETKVVTAAETARLIQMENYVKEYLKVDDASFNIMLTHHRLKKYHQLAQEYLPVDGGIASDLRNDGWLAVARYLAFNRNRDVEDNQTIKNKLKHCRLGNFIRTQKQPETELGR